MEYAKKAISCNDINSLTPYLLKKTLTKHLGRENNLQFKSISQHYYSNGFEEFTLTGTCETLDFAVHLNTADETLFLEVDRKSLTENNDLLKEINKITHSCLISIIESKIFRYEPLLSFNADYPYCTLQNNALQTNWANKNVILWVNISDPRLTYSNYLSLNLGAKYNSFIEAWLLQNDEVKLDNLIYNPKYTNTIGKVEVLEELCKEPDKRETYLRGFKKCGIGKAKVYSCQYEPEQEL